MIYGGGERLRFSGQLKESCSRPVNAAAAAFLTAGVNRAGTQPYQELWVGVPGFTPLPHSRLRCSFMSSILWELLFIEGPGYFKGRHSYL